MPKTRRQTRTTTGHGQPLGRQQGLALPRAPASVAGRAPIRHFPGDQAQAMPDAMRPENAAGPTGPLRRRSRLLAATASSTGCFPRLLALMQSYDVGKVDFTPRRHHGFAVVLFILGTLFPPLGMSFPVTIAMWVCPTLIAFFPAHRSRCREVWGQRRFLAEPVTDDLRLYTWYAFSLLCYPLSMPRPSTDPSRAGHVHNFYIQVLLRSPSRSPHAL